MQLGNLTLDYHHDAGYRSGRIASVGQTGQAPTYLFDYETDGSARSGCLEYITGNRPADKSILELLYTFDWAPGKPPEPAGVVADDPGLETRFWRPLISEKRGQEPPGIKVHVPPLSRDVFASPGIEALPKDPLPGTWRRQRLGGPSRPNGPTVEIRGPDQHGMYGGLISMAGART